LLGVDCPALREHASIECRRVRARGNRSWAGCAVWRLWLLVPCVGSSPSASRYTVAWRTMSIERNVRATREDWDRDMSGWRCAALQIPGAVVADIYHEGSTLDRARYNRCWPACSTASWN
jgi:hypothetical protein